MKSFLPKIRKNKATPQNGSDKLMEKAFESLPGEDGGFRVLRRDDRGQLKMLDVLPRDSVPNPDELLSSLQEKWGGGRYYVIPTKDGKKAGEGFGVEFDSEPKKTKKNADDSSGQKRGGKRTEEVAQLRDELRELKEKDREDRLLESIRGEIEKAVKRDGSGEVMGAVLKNLPQIVAGVSGLFGNRESAADMLEKISTILKNVESSMPQTDPIKQAKDMAELIFTIGNQSRAPVSTTGTGQQTGGGLSSFIASIIGEIEKRYLGGMAAASAAGGPVPALAPTGPGFAGSPAASREQTSFDGFAHGAKEQQTPTQEPPPIDQSQKILPGFDMKALGIDPETRLRELLASRDDPEKAGEVIVYLLNFVRTFAVPDSPIATYIESFFDNPGMMFDQMAPLVPELRGASAEYLSDLRAAIIEEVEAYARERAEQTAPPAADGGRTWQADDSEKTTLTPEQRQAEEMASTEREDTEPKVEDLEQESETAEEEAQPLP